MKKLITVFQIVLMCSAASAADFDKADSHDPSMSDAYVSPMATSWVDIATGALADTGTNTGLAWGDFDGDGDDDLYLAKDDSGQPNVLLMSNGDGTFDVCDVPILGDTGVSLNATWGDFDNDGDVDLFLANLDGGNRIFRNDGLGGTCWQFSEEFSADLGLVRESVSAEWVDYDHDGSLEVYISNRDGANQMLFSANGFTDQVPSDIDFPGASQGVAWCDFNQDLKPDLYLVTETSLHQTFAQQSPTVFTPQTKFTAISGQGCSWGDYDNDGDFDIFITYWGQDDVLWNNQGNGLFVPISAPWVGTNGKGQAAAWGDFDNDGFIDLFIANSFGPNMLYHNDGGTDQFTLVADIEGPASDRTIGAAWSDVDLDGDLDLYLCNHGTSNKLMRNDQDGATNWLQVEVRGLADGTQSNGSALGAVVRVEAGGLTMVRQVFGSTGYGSQGTQVQHFGLGAETLVDRVTVIWPYLAQNGAHHQTQVVDLVANQRVLVVEPPLVVSGVPDVQAQTNYTLGQCHPNPFNPQTTLAFALNESGLVDLRIYDVSGNLIKTLIASESRAAGDYSVVWQGRDEAGKRVSAGVYFYQFLVNGRGETRRAVMVK